MPDAPPLGPYTPIVRAGDWLMCSGQIGQQDGKLVDGGVEAQVTQAVANLSALLIRAGADLNSVAKTTVFLADMSDYAAMNDGLYGRIRRPPSSPQRLRGGGSADGCAGGDRSLGVHRRP